jgi:HlyD family secretion protein
MNLKIFAKQPNSWKIGFIVAAIVVIGGIAYSISQSSQFSQNASSKSAVTVPVATKVTALGRLEPESQIVKLSTSLDLDGDRISQLFVSEGDTVKAGQVVAILDSKKRLQDALKQAQKQVDVAIAKLVRIKAGAKSGDIQAQQAKIAALQAQITGDRMGQQETISRLEAQWQGDSTAQVATIRKLESELRNARSEYLRYEQLNREGAISNSLFDSKRLSWETAQQQLGEAKVVLKRINSTSNKLVKEAKIALERINNTGNKQIAEAEASLLSIAEVRPVDVREAQTEVENALATLKRAQTDLEQASVKAPIAGRIIKINVQVGEKIEESGIADLAQTNRMMVVAEVYQDEISKVKPGQQAIITSPALTGELRGIVFALGSRVNKQNVFSNEPGENLDRRVIDVKIRLNPEDSKKVASFVDLQVRTSIQL